MLLAEVRAPVFETNCYLVAPGPGTAALVVDPGAGAAAAVRAALAEHDLGVAAVLATHGHPDHVWDAAEVAGEAPVHVGAGDLPRLADPAAALGARMSALFRSLTARPWRRPAASAPMPGPGAVEVVPGVVVEALAAPGHTAGSTVLVLRDPDAADDAADLVAFTGDVLFAGSVGRTDLPGGDGAAMEGTLRMLARTLPGRTRLLPGHGPATTMERERAVNPYLAAALGAPD